MITLFDSRNSGNGWKVRQLLSHLNLPFERQVLNLAQGEARTPAFLAINPLGRVPVVQWDDGFCLRESNAILLHFAKNTVLLPSDPQRHSEVMAWLFFEQFDHVRNFARPRFLVSIAKSMGVEAVEVQTLLAQGYKALDVMEAHLAQHAYLVGEQYSIADIALYPYTRMAHMGGYDLHPYPQVRAWLERINGQPGLIALP